MMMLYALSEKLYMCTRRQLREALAPTARTAQVRRVVEVARSSVHALTLFLAVADNPSIAEGLLAQVQPQYRDAIQACREESDESDHAEAKVQKSPLKIEDEGACAPAPT